MRSNSASIREFFTIEKIYRIIALKSESDRIGKLLISGWIRIRIVSHPYRFCMQCYSLVSILQRRDAIRLEQRSTYAMKGMPLTMSSSTRCNVKAALPPVGEEANIYRGSRSQNMDQEWPHRIRSKCLITLWYWRRGVAIGISDCSVISTKAHHLPLKGRLSKL